MFYDEDVAILQLHIDFSHGAQQLRAQRIAGTHSQAVSRLGGDERVQTIRIDFAVAMPAPEHALGGCVGIEFELAPHALPKCAKATSFRHSATLSS